SPPLTVSGWVDSVRISTSVFAKRVCAPAGPDARASTQATATAAASEKRTPCKFSLSLEIEQITFNAETAEAALCVQSHFFTGSSDGLPGKRRFQNVARNPSCSMRGA